LFDNLESGITATFIDSRTELGVALAVKFERSIAARSANIE
jgi:hypothetical protein